MLQILIVEDNPVSAQLLAYFLRDQGNCEIVATADEAVELVGFCLEEGTPFHLICMDLNIPGDGWEAIRRLRELEAENEVSAENRARILLTTVADSDELESHADLKELYDGYLKKPYVREDLLARLEQLDIHPAQAAGD